MSRERIHIDLSAYDRQEKLEQLGLNNLSSSQMFDSLLDASIEYREMRNALEKEFNERQKDLNRKKRDYGLKSSNPLK